MYHTAQLWQSRWWGGEEIGTRGTFDQAHVEVGSAYGFGYKLHCELGVGYGNGSVNDVDGATYTRARKASHIYNPCRFTGP